MKRLLFAFFLLFHAAHAAEAIRPANRAAEPGRLVAWGDIAKDTPAADTLPKGAAAEGFIQVDTRSHAWIALREDGTVRMGGKTSWALEPFPDFGQKVVQVAISSHWTVLLEDGTVRSGGPSGLLNAGVYDSPPEVRDIVSIAVGANCNLALDRSGQLHFWGEPRIYTAKFHEKIKELRSDVTSVVGSGHQRVGWIRADGTVVYVGGFVGAQGQTPGNVRGARQIDVGRDTLVALMPDGTVAANGPKLEGLNETEAPFIGVSSGEQHRLAQRADGTWINFGANHQGEADPERLNNLLAFSLDGNGSLGWGLGIARSALAEPVADRNVPELEPLLEKLKEAEEQAGAELADWKTRYFKALDGLIAKGASRELQAAIAEERQQAEARHQPPSKLPELNRYQSVYRERLPAFLDARDEDRLSALDAAEASLQTLQDQLTREKRLEDAVTVRKVREQLVRKRVVLAEKIALATGGPGTAPVASTGAADAFPAIPPDQQIFSVKDPPLPGRLVVLGTFLGKPVKEPSDVNHRRIVQVRTGHKCWAVVDEKGNLFCDGEWGRLQYGRTARSIRGVAEIRTFAPEGAYFGWDERGKFVAWGWDGYPRKTVNFPSFVEEGPVANLRLSGGSEGRVPYVNRALALKPDGTLLAGGPQYDEGKAPWIVPSGLGPCKATYCSRYLDAVIKADGSVVAWGPREVAIPPSFSDLVAWAPGWRWILGLRRDGTLAPWITETSPRKELLAIPSGLNQVVDVVTGPDLALALRADGTWVGWGTNPDGILDQLDELKGCRKVAIGGTGLERFILGIRPESE